MTSSASRSIDVGHLSQATVFIRPPTLGKVPPVDGGRSYRDIAVVIQGEARETAGYHPGGGTGFLARR